MKQQTKQQIGFGSYRTYLLNIAVTTQDKDLADYAKKVSTKHLKERYRFDFFLKVD
jgi:hypothetical protein